MRNISLWTSAKLLAMLLLALLCLGSLPGDRGNTPALAAQPEASALSAERGNRYLALQVYFRTEAERRSLALEFGVEGVLTDDPFLIVWGDEVSYRYLLARSLRVEINAEMTEKANKIALGSSGPDTFYGGYHTVEEVEAFLTHSVQENPGLAEKVDIGDSWCKSHLGACTLPEPYGGYDLWALRITNQAIPGPKPVFWFDAGIHSREIATPELAMRFISLLLDGYETNADAHWLVDYHDIWVVPILNPDGHHIVEAGGGGSAPYLHRKNADNNDGCTDWPPSNGSQFGVDLNRNFIARWACCGQSSFDPCSLVYHGPEPGSEVETQSVISIVRALIPDQRGTSDGDAAPITTTGIYQSIHSFGAVHIYPSSFRPNPVLNAYDMQNMAHHMGAPDAGGTGYDSCDMPCSAIIDGAAIMWAYSELGVPAFTTEISGGFFFPDYSSVAGIWEENRGSLVYMAKIARTPYLTTRGPDANAVTVEPGVVVVGATAHLSATINSAWQGNLYAQNVFAAEYYIDTPPWAGGTPGSLQPSDGAYDELTENVEAEISTTGLAPGNHIIFVRGRGVSTYQGYASWGPISAAFLEVVTTPPTATATATGNPAQTPTTVPTLTSLPTRPTGSVTPAVSATVSATSGPCTINFNDVQPTDYFYEPVRYLFCNGAISGYGDNTFRPFNNTTRGQLTKIVVLAEGWSPNTSGGPHFIDVPETNPFYVFVETAYHHDIISGYSDGTFRPGNNVTRAQLCKIIVLAEGWEINTAGGPHFTDVPQNHTFYEVIETAYNRQVISGYADQTFRPGNNATRGQIAKIVYNAVTQP